MKTKEEKGVMAVGASRRASTPEAGERQGADGPCGLQEDPACWPRGLTPGLCLGHGEVLWPKPCGLWSLVTAATGTNSAESRSEVSASDEVFPVTPDKANFPPQQME